MAALLPSLAVSQARIDVRNIPLADLVDLYYRVISPAPYVVCPEVGSSLDRVSVRAPQGMTKRALQTILSANGFSLKTIKGLDVVCGVPGRGPSAGVESQMMPNDPAVRMAVRDLPQQGAADVPSGSPLSQPPVEVVPISAAPPPPVLNRSRFVYRLKNRSGSEVLPMLTAAELGSFAVIGQGTASTDGTASTTLGGNVGDVVFWTGSDADISEAHALLEMVDAPHSFADVEIYAIAVADANTDTRALSIVGSVLGLGAGIGTGGNGFSLKLGGLSIGFDALDTDRRLRVVQRWQGTVHTGGNIDILNGGSVGVVGNITESEGGRITQGITYQPTGVNLTLQPVVLEDQVRLKLMLKEQSVVSGGTTPAFETRSISADMSVCFGCLVILSRVDGSVNDQQKSRFLGLIPLGRNNQKSQSRLVYIAHVRPKPDSKIEEKPSDPVPLQIET